MSLPVIAPVAPAPAVWNSQLQLQHLSQDDVNAPPPIPTPAAADPVTPPAADTAPIVPAPPTGATAPVPTPDAGAQGASATENIDGLPDWAQKIIRDGRKEAQGLRQTREAAIAQAKKAAADEVAQSIGKALGLVEDEPDPVAAAAAAAEAVATASAEIAASRGEARLARVESAVLRAAPSPSIGDALLDSRTFAEKVAALDPTADDFHALVAQEVADAIEKNPTRFATQAPAPAPASTGGSPITGAPASPSASADGFRKSYRDRHGYAD